MPRRRPPAATEHPTRMDDRQTPDTLPAAADAGRVFVQSSDVGEIVDWVTRLFGHHRVLSMAASTEAGSVQAQRCHGLVVGKLHYGADIALDVDQERPGWVVSQVVGADGSWDGQRIQRGELLMFPPPWCGRLELTPSGGFLNAFVPVADMQEALESLLGAPLDKPLGFAPRLPMGGAQAQRLGRLIEFMFTATSGPAGVAPLLQQAWKRTFELELLSLWPHAYTRYLERGSLLPRALRRACDYIDAHLAEPMSVVQVARAALVGVRALEIGFARHLGQSPLRYIRTRRLDAARQDLCARGSPLRIGDVALKWGFANAGAFAKAYRERFGELPGQTRGTAPRWQRR